MTEEEQTLLLIRGALAGMPPAEQATVAECAEKIRSLVHDYGQHGNAAVSLVFAELLQGADA